ncbi:prolipoprotein diacylglyceryl transferase [Limibaculum sp. M0105]|uniref:Phosphatidylglycerol--prolipoprotein diacylglyceryl transferase n=1 Tax=Thermohalobaculum xanthum TaxID=2753746 RepID=A0A8J7SH23_9RHOB|nr:prolipoprotein diacylglyceryl transferase [Thermohalobaculum xanthum]MBK0399410.1 prolipoprotein diacylglyceryl transferase [Thermohalobaculum xanthum]
MPPFVLPFPQIDPAIFTLDLGGFSFSLRWYALAYIAGLVLGWRMIVALMRRPRLWPAQTPPMTPDQPEELLTWMTLGVILGGRIGYVLFYNPAQFLANPAEIFAIWEGGMSFHGGFLGVILGVVGFAWRKGAPLLSVGDAVALAAPLGILFGRLANFINGELWGRPTDVPWAMVFPHAGPEPRHPSQLYEAGLEGLVLGLVMWWLALRAGWLRRPGALIGVFFLGYGLARSFVENFRLADEQFRSAANPLGHVIRFGSQPDAWGLTMGQILSLPMVAIGLGFLAFAMTRRQA